MEIDNGKNDYMDSSFSKFNSKNKLDINNLINLGKNDSMISNYKISNNNQPLIPILKDNYLQPVYVNPKQYEAILRRRYKRIKIKYLKELINSNNPNNYSENGVTIKKKFKYKSRSDHAKTRKRDKNGRFYKKDNKNEKLKEEFNSYLDHLNLD